MAGGGGINANDADKPPSLLFVQPQTVLVLDKNHHGSLFRRAHLLIRQEKLDEALKDLVSLGT
jgi:hypothetical protein